MPRPASADCKRLATKPVARRPSAGELSARPERLREDRSVREGTWREHNVYEGCWRDEHHYGILAGGLNARYQPERTDWIVGGESPPASAGKAEVDRG